ncbi:glutamine-hydrolyzing GMP synthase [Aquicella lusitana]|uniref:GMP synthase [glutamine-hydrolyzing] n=1 Tax=Aquicella lusitana TaxID=254246 RepID=A0A370GNC5_9COXI|nr:glutamine-hydrolyzing GMP synthase [Aquicella lusitana]RDI44819.1 GMP synthase (glutamine-hydrolysing) [Aquicella lusitana]VVC73016.1 GMP synthase [glutamine-hydrolyzing] [Aquicella lusitana]
MTTDIHAHRILILDFGSQYTQLIARRVREIGVYCEIHSALMSNEEIQHFNPAGVILSGGPETVTAFSTLRIPDIVFALGRPVLGICYGMQAMAHQLGGKVEPGSHQREFGYAQVAIRDPSRLLEGIEDHLTDDGLSLLDVWMSHGDHVSALPQYFKTMASTSNCPIAAMADEERNFYGLQFHPEVSHTRQGKRIIERFVLDICNCQPNWTSKNIIDEQIESIRQQVGNDKVLLALSGGVDSSVAALMLHKAIGDQLTCVFVDTGLLRLKEAEQIQSIFKAHFGLNLITVDAKEEFFQALSGVEDPEAKRKVIGKKFIDVFDRQAEQLENIKWLAQGTIYSDVIESAATKTGKAHVIKSHHNVGGLPENMQLQLLEPLRELFKDEVRKIGIELGMPYELIYRHPFPGPGLGVRVLGEIKPEYVEKLRRADAILIEELYKADLYYKVSQAFAVFLPVKSVGVIGDARHYDHVIAIRAVETLDFMTAHWARLPYAFLEVVSNRIINEVPGISRVTYDISSKPPATIEWE